MNVSQNEPTVNKNLFRENSDLQRVNAVLERQNVKLREDVKDLIELQKRETGGTMLKPKRIEAAVNSVSMM